jgi:hypothetical protein
MLSSPSKDFRSFNKKNLRSCENERHSQDAINIDSYSTSHLSKEKQAKINTDQPYTRGRGTNPYTG